MDAEDDVLMLEFIAVLVIVVMIIALGASIGGSK